LCTFLFSSSSSPICILYCHISLLFHSYLYSLLLYFPPPPPPLLSGEEEEWPLQWLKVVDMLNIFGFQVCPIYKQTLQMSVDSCFKCLRKTVMSWNARQLNTLVERVEVLRIFATSKLRYKASAIPLPTKFAERFESLMGSFVWLGKLERLKIDEIMNDRALGLPCVLSKSNALFLKQSS
jgi:hypothetical protein